MRERYPYKNPINDAIIRLENTLHNPLHDEMMVIYKLGLEDGKFDVLDSIRAEIDSIELSGLVDGHTKYVFVRTAEQVKNMALDIIDKYKAESEDI